MFKEFLRTDNSTAQLFIRLALGVVMFPHGAQKVLGWFGGLESQRPFKPLQGWVSLHGRSSLSWLSSLWAQCC